METSVLVVDGIDMYLDSKKDAVCIEGRVHNTIIESGYVRHLSLQTQERTVIVTLGRKARLTLRENMTIWVIGENVSDTHILARTIIIPDVRQIVDLFSFRELSMAPCIFVMAGFLFSCPPLSLLFLNVATLLGDNQFDIVFFFFTMAFLSLPGVYYLIFFRVPNPHPCTPDTWDRLESILNEKRDFISIYELERELLGGTRE